MNEDVKLLSYRELGEKLNISIKTVRKNWKAWPHVLVGPKATLRYARFDFGEVLEHLKAQTELHKH